MTVTPEILQTNKEIRDMLWSFDFVVVDTKSMARSGSIPRRWSRLRSWRSEAPAAFTH